MPRYHSNLATLNQAAFNCLSSKGFDAADMFRRAGLDPDKIVDVNARYGVQQVNRLWRIAIQETNNSSLLYEIVDYIEPWMMQAFGYSWVSSHSLLSALGRSVRYHRMLSTNIEVRLEQMQGAYLLRANLKDSEGNPATDAVVVVLMHMSREGFGDDLTPLEVQLTRARPEDTGQIDSFFRCKVEYGCSENYIVFSTTDVNRRAQAANPAIAHAMDEVVVDYLAQFDAHDVVNRVRQIVAQCLVHGEPDKEFIAKELNLTTRTLQRRLEEQQSSVKEVIDATRHQLAIDYLNQKQSSIKEIAYSLGFSDPSNFSRSFKRWEGQTPKEYRNAVS